MILLVSKKVAGSTQAAVSRTQVMFLLLPIGQDVPVGLAREMGPRDARGTAFGTRQPILLAISFVGRLAGRSAPFNTH